MIGIVATDNNGGIGKDGKIPWFGSGCFDPKEDLKRFKVITSDCDYDDKKNVVIMGRKTWESIGKVLPGRINIVLSKTEGSINESYFNGDYLARSKQDVINYLLNNYSLVDKIFVIGGKEIYSLFYDEIETFELTIVNNKFECDTFIDLKKIYNDFKLEKVDQRIGCVNLTMTRDFC